MEYEDILSRKLNPRDQAKAILEYTKSEIRRDVDQNSRIYAKLDNLETNYGLGNGTVIPDDEFNDVVSGLISKLDFSSKVLVDKILFTCTEMLMTACSEQGELMSFAMQEMKNSLTIFTSTIKSLHSIILALLNEKNIFASKALTLAKAVRSVYFHDLELTTLQPTVSYYTILSDICIRNFVSIPRVLQTMFLNQGGTTNCNRYTCKEEGNSLDRHISSTNPFESDFDLVTSVNDMVEYLETTYTSKIMTQFVADVKSTVMSILSEMKAKAELEERKKNTAEKLSKLAVVAVSHTSRSRHMVLSSENESESLVQQIVFQRRNDASFTIQCCYYRYKQRLRIRKRRRDAAVLAILRFFRISRLKMIIFRKIVKTFMKKHAARVIRRSCLVYFLSIKKRKWAIKIIVRNLKILWRNWSCLKIAVLVKELSRGVVQTTWASKYGEFEKRLRRVECFLELCAPITIAQHALTHSKTIQSQSNEDRDVYHQRLLKMTKWDWYHESDVGYEELLEDHQLSFAHMCLSPESLDGFGSHEIIQGSLDSLEERCSVYSIIGSSVLRYGTIPITTKPFTDVNKTGDVLKKKTTTSRVRAQTINERKIKSDSSSVPVRPKSRISQKPIFRAAPPDEMKPSQPSYRRTMITTERRSPSPTRPVDPLPSNSIKISEEQENKSIASLSSLALSESDEEEGKVTKIPLIPKSGMKKFRSTFTARETLRPFSSPSTSRSPSPHGLPLVSRGGYPPPLPSSTAPSIPSFGEDLNSSSNTSLVTTPGPSLNSTTPTPPPLNPLPHSHPPVPSSNPSIAPIPTAPSSSSSSASPTTLPHNEQLSLLMKRFRSLDEREKENNS